ncbi:TatD family hydrolase [Spirochaetia bacterium]|nr:TatD family hydrolase [Spirochaetia bacterium]
MVYDQLIFKPYIKPQELLGSTVYMQNEKIERNLKGLFDSHAHISYLDERGIDAKKLMFELFDAGFAGIIDIGTEPGDLKNRIKMFCDFKKIKFAAGIWPWKHKIVKKEEEVSLLESEIAAAPLHSVVCIGECGFDRIENPSSPPEERELLEMQLVLAEKLVLPIMIHSRNAFKETLETLSNYKNVRGIIHCFSYGAEEAKSFLDLGYDISFAGNLTFKNAQNLRDAIKIVPRDRLLLETDSPFLAPAPYRGKPCSPLFIEETYKTAADILQIDIEILKQSVLENALSIFGGNL